MILRSSAAYAISHGVGHLLMFFGKLLITCVCTFVGYIMITQISYFSSEIFTPIMPTIVTLVIILRFSLSSVMSLAHSLWMCLESDLILFFFVTASRKIYTRVELVLVLPDYKQFYNYDCHIYILYVYILTRSLTL